LTVIGVGQEIPSHLIKSPQVGVWFVNSCVSLTRHLLQGSSIMPFSTLERMMAPDVAVHILEEIEEEPQVRL
jgi:hypothetical protein